MIILIYMQSKKSWLKPLKSVFLFFTLAEPFWEELVKLKRRSFFNRNPKKRIQYISKNWSMKGVLVLRKIKDAFFRLYRCKGVKVYKFWKFWTHSSLTFFILFGKLRKQKYIVNLHNKQCKFVPYKERFYFKRN